MTYYSKPDYKYIIYTPGYEAAKRILETYCTDTPLDDAIYRVQNGIPVQPGESGIVVHRSISDDGSECLWSVEQKHLDEIIYG
jgi:hypothetical protein